MSAMIVRTIEFKTSTVMVQLYKAMVRPILEYANSVWAPYKKKDIESIERVQGHFTKTIIGMKGLNYEERLCSLNLPSLVYRRKRGDILQVYKIINKDYDPLTTTSLLTITHDRTTRSNNTTKLFKRRTNYDKYKFFFTNRVTNAWNSLPDKVVNVNSINSLKNNLDNYYKNCIYSTEIEI